MKLRTRVVLQLATLCFVLGAYGFAADNAYLYIVHAIPGRDVATNVSPGFPLDILLNGETCLPRDVSFSTISGPYSFSPGTYEVLISEANTLAPCTNPPLVTSEVSLTGGESVSAVAAVNSGQPDLLLFPDILVSVPAGSARFVLTHAADALALEATLTQIGVTKPKTYTVTASPGKQQAITVPAGTYLVTVAATGSSTVLASEQILMPDQSANFTYAAGEAANNTMALFNKTVPAVF